MSILKYGAYFSGNKFPKYPFDNKWLNTTPSRLWEPIKKNFVHFFLHNRIYNCYITFYSIEIVITLLTESVQWTSTLCIECILKALMVYQLIIVPHAATNTKMVSTNFTALAVVLAGSSKSSQFELPPWFMDATRTWYFVKLSSSHTSKRVSAEK